MAHRCGGALAPENTLPGLGITVALGGHGVEFDVMLSAEGTPWVIHDETLDRTTDAQGPVCEKSDAALALVDAGCRHHKAFRATRLPTFAVLMAGCRTLGLLPNVEIKPATGFERVTGTVVARTIVQRHWDAPGALVLSSFSEEALEAAGLEAPHLPRALLIDRVPEDWASRCSRLGVMAIHTNCAYLTRQQTEAIRGAGLQLAVYTENDPAHARELHAWGVACIITDRPDIVTEAVLASA
jgi:glycerophosphoryl diester phosphodiesterase